MRAPVLTLILILLLAAAVAGCGGDEGEKRRERPGRSDGGDKKGAEEAVRTYLRALVRGDGARACEQFAPEYEREVLEQNEEFVRKNEIGNCASLVNAVTAQSPRTTFEDQPLNERTVDKIDLRVTVRLSGDEQNATVTGPRGLQRYELETRDGKWAITRVVQRAR